MNSKEYKGGWLALQCNGKETTTYQHYDPHIAIVPKWLPVIDIGVISLSSEFQPCSSSNG